MSSIMETSEPIKAKLSPLQAVQWMITPDAFRIIISTMTNILT